MFLVAILEQTTAQVHFEVPHCLTEYKTEGRLLSSRKMTEPVQYLKNKVWV